MLRKIRIALAAVFFLGITLLFYGIGQSWWGWMAKVQFLPSALRVVASATALNIAILAGLTALCLISGRIYCSVICPLGVMQDLAISIRHRLGKVSHRPLRFHYRKENRLLRYGFLALTLAALIAGLQMLVGLIAPYSAYGRIVRSVVSAGNGSTGLPLILTAAATFILVTALAASMGRIWCNSVCPVGTVLGLLSRHALYAPRIDAGRCNGCGACSRNCKASCIDGENHSIDLSRCVMCMDCIGNCKAGAISFGRTKTESGKREPEDDGGGMSRRAFLGTAALLGSSVAAEAARRKLPKGFTEKQAPKRQTPIVPPGAKSFKVFTDTCTACGLCISACENKVLRPSTEISRLLQPEMSFEKGWCRPECNACADICPTGAILPLKEGEKSVIKIGTAKVDYEKCLAATGKSRCDNCVRHCPTGALRTVDGNYGISRVVVNEEKCIGCGACEYLCPVNGISAITVEGSLSHTRKD